jgi:hypothetical protein
MMTFEGIAEMANGERVPFRGGPREWAQWEAYALAQGLPPRENARGDNAGMTLSFFLAWASLTRGQPERPSFDDWMGELGGVAEFALESLPPTRPGASDTRSRSSQPQPESLPESYGSLTDGISRPSLRS